jgi:hypothetical protein
MRSGIKTLGAFSPPKPLAFRFAKPAHKTVSEAPPFLLTRRRFLSGSPDERGALDPSGILRQRFPKGNREREYRFLRRSRKKISSYKPRAARFLVKVFARFFQKAAGVGSAHGFSPF